MSESEQYYQALRLRGIPTLLVRVPGAPHALDQRPSQLNARIAYILAWFAKHDPAASPPTAPAASESIEPASRAGE
jgi:acetyl esterase/lipase